MTPTPATSEKCSNCGEANSTALKTCGLCGAVMPWLLKQRADEATAQQNKTAPKRAKPLPPSPQGAPSQTPPVQRVWSVLWKSLPRYGGTETPMIAMGNVELPLSSMAALVGFLLLALSPFAPIVSVLIINLNLLSASPLLGWGNLAAAGIAGVALAQQSLRWCYLSFFIGTASLGFIFLKMSQFPIESVNPWRMVQWGIVPLVLGPIACFVAAFFVGVPVEEETEAANPFGHDEVKIFQNRIYLRLKELSQTQAFQDAIRANPEGVKAQLHQLRAATSWAEVAPETQRLLEGAEKELDSSWELSEGHSATSEATSERASVPGWFWPVVGMVPVALALFFMLKPNPQPVERDLGLLTRYSWQSSAGTELLVGLLEGLEEISKEYPDAPLYTLHGEMPVLKNNPNIAKNLGTLIYDKSKKQIVIRAKVRVAGKERSVPTSETDDVEPEDVSALTSHMRGKIEVEIAKQNVEDSAKSAERAMRDFDSRMNELKNSFR